MRAGTAPDPRERRRVALLVALRLMAVLLLTLALVNPPWRRPVRDRARPPLTLLLDASPSMSAAGPSSRLPQVEAMLASASVRQALGRFTVTTIRCAEGLTTSVTAAGGTDLDLALRQAAARTRRGPLLIISDGAETHGAAAVAAAQLRAAGRSVGTIGVGPTDPPPNLGPIVIQAPRLVREKQPVPLRALVRATGCDGPQPVQVELDGKLVATLSTTLVPGATAAAKHQLPGLNAGMHLLTVKTPARSTEATTADNTRSQLIEARRDETRLVLLAGAPDPDYAALRRLLGRVPKLRATAIVRLGPGRSLQQEGDRTVRQPTDLPRLLRDAHVVVLMNYAPSAAEATALRGFVQGGGALGWLAGPQAAASSLGGLLPASAQGTHAAVLTPVGAPLAGSSLGAELLRAAPAAMWREAPFLAGVTALGRSRAGAETVLTTGAGRPGLVTATVGAGATLVFGGAGTYRWLLSAEADDTSRRLHEVFWQTVIGWLSQPRDQRRLVVMLDPAVAPAGQPVRLIAACGGQPTQITAQVTGPGPKLALPLSPAGAEPGRYTTTLSNLPPGRYSVRVQAQVAGATLTETRPLVVEPGGVEMAETVQQVAKLQEIAEAGGGGYVPLAQLAELLGRLPVEAARAATWQTTRPARGGLTLGLVMVLLCGEWWLRRRWGR